MNISDKDYREFHDQIWERNKELIKENRKLKQELEETETARMLCEKNWKRCEQELEQNKKLCDRLDRDFKAVDHNYWVETHRNEELTRKIDKLMLDLDEKETEIERNINIINDIEKANEKFVARIGELEEELKVTHSDLDNAKALLETYRKECAKLRSDKKDIEDHYKNYNDIQKENEDLLTRIDMIRNVNEELNTAANNILDENIELNEQLKTYVQRIRKLEKDNNDLNKELAKANKLDVVCGLNHEIKGLKSENQKHLDRIDKLEKSLQNYKSDLEYSTDKYDDILVENNKLKEQLKTQADILSEYLEHIGKLEDENHDLELANDCLRDEIEDLQDRIGEAMDILDGDDEDEVINGCFFDDPCCCETPVMVDHDKVKIGDVVEVKQEGKGLTFTVKML